MLNRTEFKELFDTHFDAIRNFIFYRSEDLDIASDVAQNVFLKVWEKREQLTNDNLKALLYKMANEMYISSHRKKMNRESIEQSITFYKEVEFSPEDEMLFEEFKRSYASVLERMPEACRVVFLMSRNDELKYNEIAQNLNISVKTVEKRMSTALQFLRTNLQERNIEDETREY